MVLTITKTTNGAWVFTPSSGKVKRDGKPKCTERDGKFSFWYETNESIVKDVLYSDITIVDSDGTDYDGFANSTAVIDKLVELNFFFSVGGGADLGYTEYVASLTQSGTSNPVVTELHNTLGYVPTIARAGVGSTGIILTDLDAAKTVVELTPRSASGKRLVPNWTVSGANIILRTFNDANGANEDDMLIGNILTIRVYP